MEWFEIFDISLFRSLIRSATPIALIGFGAAMCSAAGVLNIGLEGKMLNAAFIGIAASYYSGSALTGFICGVLAGVLTAVLFGVLSYNLGADEVLAGLAINIFAIATAVASEPPLPIDVISPDFDMPWKPGMTTT